MIKVKYILVNPPISFFLQKKNYYSWSFIKYFTKIMSSYNHYHQQIQLLLYVISPPLYHYHIFMSILNKHLKNIFFIKKFLMINDFTQQMLVK